jgi:hypothetical protein
LPAENRRQPGLAAPTDDITTHPKSIALTPAGIE